MEASYPLSSRVRWLVDADCFFVSCERLRDPTLLDRPVCVGGSIIVAVSYEAKAYNVRVGTPLREAKKMLPKDAIFCQPDFKRYQYISQQLSIHCQQLTPHVYQASIDEVYLDLTQTKPPYTDWQARCAGIQHILITKTGIPLTLGCAPTPLLAKLFATIHKPQGCGVALEQASIHTLLKTAPIAKVSGIGRKTLPKLPSTVSTAFDYINLPLSTVNAHFGLSWRQLRHGLHSHALVAHLSSAPAPKSISASRSFHQAIQMSEHALRQHLMHHRERVFVDLMTAHLQTKHIRIALRDESLHRHTYETQLPAYTQDKQKIQVLLKKLLMTHYQADTLYRGTGVWVASLIQTPRYTPWLFEETTHHQKVLTTCMEQINKKRGKSIIRPATLQ
jgi:DNA polymerase-4